MDKIKKIYNVLLSKFGFQGWWPLTTKGFHPEHHSGRPKAEKHKFEIIIGAILTQNTNWKNVEKALYNLNRNDLIDIEKIDNIETKKLALLIRPSGYYNQKAKTIKNFSNFLFKNYDGNLNLFFKNNIGDLREELLSKHGIGPETADSIILYAAEKPTFVIDAYTKRIYSRIFNIKLDYDGLKNIFENNLKDKKIFNEYHALLVELGKNYCKNRNPLCGGCPVNKICTFNKKIHLKNSH